MKASMDYKPIIITQIREKQNEFLVADDFLMIHKQEFSAKLYEYIDDEKPLSTLRLFRYCGYIYLIYYWLSDLKEPESGRDGMYLILGMSCSIKKFKNSPLTLALKFNSFINIIADEFHMGARKNPTKIMRSLWNSDKPYDFFSKVISAGKVSGIFYSDSSIYKTGIVKLFFRKIKAYDILFVLSNLDLYEYINIFVCYTAQYFTVFDPGFDYSDTPGYGKKAVMIISHTSALPLNIKKVKLGKLKISYRSKKIIKIRLEHSKKADE